jgi:hypothetical protein
MDSASALDSTKMPALQLGFVQTSRAASIRQHPRIVRAAPRTLQILLATVLLDYFTRRHSGIGFLMVVPALCDYCSQAKGI